MKSFGRLVIRGGQEKNVTRVRDYAVWSREEIISNKGSREFVSIFNISYRKERLSPPATAGI